VTALKAAVMGMGVLIVAMMALLVVGLSRRPPSPAPLTANIVLKEPAGTHIASLTQAGLAWAVLLQGGGPDRIVVLAPDGHVQARVSLQSQ
jgi:hypothetical protein